MNGRLLAQVLEISPQLCYLIRDSADPVVGTTETLAECTDPADGLCGAVGGSGLPLENRGHIVGHLSDERAGRSAVSFQALLHIPHLALDDGDLGLQIVNRLFECVFFFIPAARRAHRKPREDEHNQDCSRFEFHNSPVINAMCRRLLPGAPPAMMIQFLLAAWRRSARNIDKEIVPIVSP